MKNSINQAIILAGGKGERLQPFTYDNPKPMYKINNIPFIERLVLQIREFGIRKIIILLGYLPDKIINYLGDGSKYDVEITYDITPLEYDTSQRLYHVKDLLEDNFLLMYCDNYCPIDYKLLVNNYFKHNALIELSVYNNYDNYTKNNVYIENEKIIVYDKTHTFDKLQGVEIGYAIYSKKVLDYLDDNHKNLSNIFQIIADQNKLFATTTEHRYYSIGSYDRMNLTEEFFKEKKVVFIDRDGTINVKAPKACYIESPKDFKWLNGAKKAIKLLNDNGYIVILVTNQPGIARGNFTLETLNSIHEKMQNDLKKINAKIDYIYYCPHNWDENCNCRKPKPGMLYMAQKDLSLNLTKCILFGDDERDIMTADAARCKSKLISENYPLINAVNDLLERKL